MADIELVGLTNPPGVSWQSDIHRQMSSVELVTLAKQGGMGFQYEGGIITVSALSDRVNVSFDRPMVYSGAHSHSPAAVWFDIGTPFLDPAATSLSIPLSYRPRQSSFTPALELEHQAGVLMAGDPMGADVSALPDLDISPRSGRRILAEALARRLTTPRGALFYAPNYGTDVRTYLLARLDRSALANLRSEVERECEKDDRVEAATATVTLDGESMRIALSVETAEGPFAFTIAITALTLDLLE